MLTVGTCRICESGPLGLRLCGACNKIVILCKECDAAWVDSQLEMKPVYADEESMPCPHCQESLWDEQATWASEEEIGKVSWIAEAIKSGDLALDDKEDDEPSEIA